MFSHLSEQCPLAIRLAFAFQSVHGLLQDGQGPLAQIFLFWSIIVRRFEPIALLRRLFIQRNEKELPAALLPVSAGPFTREEGVQHRQEKSAELPLLAIRQPKMLFGD